MPYRGFSCSGAFESRCFDAPATDKKDSEKQLSLAHQYIATVLNDRGVYQDALTHAREAVALANSNAWAFHQQSLALQRI